MLNSDALREFKQLIQGAIDSDGDYWNSDNRGLSADTLAHIMELLSATE